MFSKEVIDSFKEVIQTGERSGHEYIFGWISTPNGDQIALAVLDGDTVHTATNPDGLLDNTLDFMLDTVVGMGIPRNRARKWAKSCDKVDRLAQVLHSIFEKGELKSEDTVQVVAHHLASWDDSFFRLVEAKRNFNK